MIIKLQNVRLAFPQIFEAKAFQGGDDNTKSFTASFLIDPKTPVGAALTKEIEAGIEEVAKAKWGAKAPAIVAAMKKQDKTCLHDGNSKADYDGFADMMYVSTRSKTKPLVLDRDKTPLTIADGKPYGGCFVNTSIELWPQDNGYGKRINASLRGIQFAKDGDAFAGGAPADESEFDDLSDGADAGEEKLV